MTGRLASLIVVLAGGLLAAGCRFDVQRIENGEPITAEVLAGLVPGRTTLDEALAACGAPDGVQWAPTSDVLLYDHWALQRTRWELENPFSFLGPLTPQSFVGEAIAYVLFVAERTEPLPTTLIESPRLGRPAVTSKPLTLRGAERGHHQLRLVFDRDSRLLERVEIARGIRRGGATGIARGAFLR